MPGDHARHGVVGAKPAEPHRGRLAAPALNQLGRRTESALLGARPDTAPSDADALWQRPPFDALRARERVEGGRSEVHEPPPGLADLVFVQLPQEAAALVGESRGSKPLRKAYARVDELVGVERAAERVVAGGLAAVLDRARLAHQAEQSRAEQSSHDPVPSLAVPSSATVARRRARHNLASLDHTFADR